MGRRIIGRVGVVGTNGRRRGWRWEEGVGVVVGFGHVVAASVGTEEGAAFHRAVRDDHHHARGRGEESRPGLRVVALPRVGQRRVNEREDG